MIMKALSQLRLNFLFVSLFFYAEGAFSQATNQVNNSNNLSNIAALEDPYFEISSYSVQEISNENDSKLNDLETDSILTKSKNPKRKKKNLNSFVPTDSTATTSPSPSPSPTSEINEIIMIIDELIAVGQKIADIVKEGKAIVNNNSMAAISVLPRSEGKDPVVHDMGGWSLPVSKRYKIFFNNAYGTEVVSFIYSISFQYNGSTNGKGKYLAGVRASARNVNVLWGYDLDASSQLIQIANVGTQENVVAGATLEVSLTVKNWTKTTVISEGFFVTGAGQLYKLD